MSDDSFRSFNISVRESVNEEGEEIAQLDIEEQVDEWSPEIEESTKDIQINCEANALNKASALQFLKVNKI